jgi:hypothetical protein
MRISAVKIKSLRIGVTKKGQARHGADPMLIPKDQGFFKHQFRNMGEEVAKLDVRISEVKADLIRWMFIFWVGQIGATLGILFAFFRR